MKIEYQKLIIAILIPLLVGFISSFFMDLEWYNTLNKPVITPPNWVFMPVWTTLYVLMGIAFYLVWIKFNKFSPLTRTTANVLYHTQLFLNFSWTLFFFGFKEIELSLIIILLLLVFIIATLASFFMIDKRAGYLLTPYLIWVFFATLLNASFVVSNY